MFTSLSDLPYKNICNELSITLPSHLPTYSQCPLCHSRQTLHITYGLKSDLVCKCINPSCQFFGDILELFSKVKNIPLSESIRNISCQYNLPNQIEQQLHTFYTQWSHYRNWWLSVLKFTLEHPSVLYTVCKNIHFGDPAHILPYVGIALGRTITSEFPLRSQLRRNEYYVLIPAWVDCARFSGFYICLNASESIYVPLNASIHDHGYGFLPLWVSTNNQPFYILQSPQQASRFLTQAIQHGYQIPLLCAHQKSSTHILPKNTPSVYLFKSSDIDFIKLALSDPQSESVFLDFILEKPISFTVQMQEIQRRKMPTKEALVKYITHLPAVELQSFLKALQLKTETITQMLQYASIPEKERILTYLETNIYQTTIHYNNKTIQFRPDGWYSIEDQVRITNTPFIIEKIIIDKQQDAVLAFGKIYQNTKIYEFHVDLETLKKRTEEWLQSEMLQNGGEFVFISPGWAKKIFHLAVTFHEPQTIYIGQEAVWSDDKKTLLLPNCKITKTSIEWFPEQSQYICSGHKIAPISTEKLHSLPDSLLNDDTYANFWTVFVSISAVAFSQYCFGQFPLFGFVDDESGSLSTMLKNASTNIPIPLIDIPNQTDISSLLEEENAEQAVFPFIVSEVWDSPHITLAHFANHHTNRKLFVTVSKLVALATYLSKSNLIYIVSHKTTKDVDYDMCAEYWNLLPYFWIFLQNVFPEKKTYPIDIYLKAISQSVIRWLRHIGYETPYAPRVASDLVRYQSFSSHAPRGYRILQFLHENICEGIILCGSSYDELSQTKIIKTAESYFIPYSTIEYAFLRLKLLPPSSKEITEKLIEASCIETTQHDTMLGFVIPEQKWNQAQASQL